MAESAVSFLVEKLAMLVKEEAKLLKGVGGEIEFLLGEFDSMKAFLETAELWQVDNRELKVWVKQVTEVAYDTEDILDEFMLNLERHHGHGFMRYFHKIKPSIHNLKARHHIASKIANVKLRVESISKRHRRYNFESYRTKQSASVSTGGTSWRDFREDAFLVEEGELVAIDEPRKEIIKWLTNGEPTLEVVSISGMGGAGKTTLAGRVYNDRNVRNKFESHAWISVSQSYKIEDIMRDMIAQLYREIEQPVPQGIEHMKSTSLKREVKDFLQQKRYVIVLDDVWKSEALDDIKNAMPDSNVCSRIIVTSRSADVATGSSHQSKVYNLEPLSPEESWSLFCKKAFRGKPCPPHLEHISRQILKKCEGLPLAIVTIGGLLYAKDVQEWEIISRNLAAELESNGTMQNIRKIFNLSYNDLHYNLKSCFLYLGVFPEDHAIESTRLIRLWIAEGFVEEREGMTGEEVAQRYLNELINRSLVQIAETTSQGRLKSCRVHDLMHELILSKLRNENFVSFAPKKNEKSCERVRRLSVQYTCTKALKQLSLPSLRSLLIFKSGKLSSSDEQFLPSGCRLLRVLDLRGSSLHKFPQQIPVLSHLKYLSLRGTKVRIIPKSIGELQSLETLDLKHTLVSELPVEITKLKKLRYLLVYHNAKFSSPPSFAFKMGFSAPRGIGVLTSLQKLYYVKAGGGWNKNTMQELRELCKLRRLGVTDLKKDDAKELCHSLEEMTNLQSLEVAAESESEVIDLDFLSTPPPLLRSLYIDGGLENLPHWLPLLNNLTSVYLGWSRLKSSPLIALQNLPNLVQLSLLNAFDGETLVFRDRTFPKLKKLFLSDMENLRSLSMDGEAMPCLQSLNIVGCRHLDWKSLLVVIRGLTLLESLNFFEMPEEFARAFDPYSSGITREGVLQDYYEEVMERNPQVSFHRRKGDHSEPHDPDDFPHEVIRGQGTSLSRSCSGPRLSSRSVDRNGRRAFGQRKRSGPNVRGQRGRRTQNLLEPASP